MLFVDVPDGLNVTEIHADGMPAVSVDTEDLNQLEIVSCR